MKFTAEELQLAAESAEQLSHFFRSFARAARPLLLLDYDGTLAPFRVDRFKARPWAGVRELLAKIQNQGKTRLVVVSGRPSEEILPLLALHPAPEIWGLHGSEHFHPDGRREVEQLAPEVLARLDALARQLRSDDLGGLIEQKPNAIVMHWRGVSTERARLIEQRTRELFEPAAQIEGLRLLQFESGLELRAGRDKGQVVQLLLQEQENQGSSNDPAAYLGDDITDESAFKSIKGRGLAVLVRGEYRATAADLWLQPPRQLRHFLDRWLQACSGL